MWHASGAVCYGAMVRGGRRRPPLAPPLAQSCAALVRRRSSTHILLVHAAVVVVAAPAPFAAAGTVWQADHAVEQAGQVRAGGRQEPVGQLLAQPAAPCSLLDAILGDLCPRGALHWREWGMCNKDAPSCRGGAAGRAVAGGRMETSDQECDGARVSAMV